MATDKNGKLRQARKLLGEIDDLGMKMEGIFGQLEDLYPALPIRNIVVGLEVQRRRLCHDLAKLIEAQGILPSQGH